MSQSSLVRTNPKYLRRLRAVLANSVNSILLPVFNLSVSFLVIRTAGPDLWGEFVGILIFIQLASHLLYWGNKEYLLREFSRNPSGIERAWQTSLFSRGLLILIVVPITLLAIYPTAGAVGVLLWGLGLYVAQSIDVLILYRRNFGLSILVELAGTALVCAAVLSIGGALTLDALILAFAMVQMLKALAYAAFYYPSTFGAGRGGNHISGRVDLGFLAQAFPFFLLTFSGLLQSRMDLYIVNHFFPDDTVAQYQVFINMMIYLQSLGAFILTPFVKDLYRLGYPAILRISRRLFLFGLVCLPPLLLLAEFLISWLFLVELPPVYLVFGGLFVLPTYYYLPMIYAHYKAERQNTVLAINIAGAALTLALNLALLPRIGILGAVVSIALVKWTVLLVYAGLFRGLAARHPALPEPTL